MIISVHTPKSGGSSFRDLLQNYFVNNFITDYDDKPLMKSFKSRVEEAEIFKNNFEINPDKVEDSCIHGHFLPYKYSSLIEHSNVLFITWLRDPIERVASHYHYWKRTENNSNIIYIGDLREKVKKEKWSLEKFCFSMELQNIYCSFFWNFPIDKVEFIGITEYFSTDVKYFASKYLNKEIYEIPYKNVNKTKIGPYFKDAQLIKELKQFHSKDYKMYEESLFKRQIRINNSAPMKA